MEIIEIVKAVGKFTIVCIAAPTVVYFCVKFGTVAFYKAKQYIEKENMKGN